MFTPNPAVPFGTLSAAVTRGGDVLYCIREGVFEMINKRNSPRLACFVALGLFSASAGALAVPTPSGDHVGRHRLGLAMAAAQGTHQGKSRGRHQTPQVLPTAASVFSSLGSVNANRASDVSLLANSVAKTSSLKSINLRNANVTLTAGVYDLSKLQLDHSTLTLSGSGYFIFNISNSMALTSGKILMANGATESNALFNYTGTSQPAISSRMIAGAQNESVLHGILLALNAKVDLAPGLVVGEIISGQNSSNGSAASGQPNVAAAVPDRASTFALSIIALGGIAVFRAFIVRRGRIGRLA